MTANDRRAPAFDAGNAVALQHGAYSSRVVEPVAVRLAAELEAASPEWLADVDRAAVDAYARAEARVEVLARWLDEHGMLADDGKVRPAADLLVRLERLAADARSRLGLDPLSRARLGRDTAVARAAASSSVRAAAEAGRLAREQRGNDS